MKVVHVIIHGRIHGVGFRQFIKSNAQKLGIVGWVQNNEDKTVEAMFQPSAGSGQEGDKAIAKMIECCNVGPMLADVRKVEVNEMEETFPYEAFEIL